MDEMNTILVVEDDEALSAILDKRLTGAGKRVLHAGNGAEAFKKTKDLNPDLILMDISMPVINGIQVKAKLNFNQETARIPVIFLTADADVNRKVEGFRLRADDYITKPFDWDELHARIDMLLYKHSYFHQLSLQDELTGLPNAKYFKTQLASLLDVAKKHGRIFSLAVLDINYFKQINDGYGHQAGDKVLREVASRMQSVIRRPDILARYGGDEFVILFAECDQEKAEHALVRLKAALQELSVWLPEAKETIHISLSAGVAAYTPEILEATQLFEIADRNMYKDKAAQR